MENISELVSVKYPCVTLSPWRLCALAVLLCLKSPYHVNLTPYRAPINQNMVNITRVYSKPMKASLTQLPPDRWNPASLGREVNLTLHSLQPHPTPQNSLRPARCSCTRARRRCPEFLGLDGKVAVPCKNLPRREKWLDSPKQTLLWKKIAVRFRRIDSSTKDRWPHHVVPKGILLSPIYLSASPV